MLHDNINEENIGKSSNRIITTRPTTLFVISFKAEYINKKYHSGIICFGVIIELDIRLLVGLSTNRG